MLLSMTRFLRLTAFLLIFSSIAFFAAAEENRPGLSLEQTFEIYVRAVQNSDLESLFTTVTDSHDFFFLTAQGKLIGTREGYHRFHDEWFKETGWEMPVELLAVREGIEYGTALARFHYKQKLPEGGEYNLDSYFTLIFHKEGGMWKVVGDVCTPISRYQTEENPDIRYSAEQTYVFNMIKNRRTVRKYKPAPVPEEHILKILDAVRFAPTAGNQQPWKFLVIRDRTRLDALQEASLSWYLDRYRRQNSPTEEELNSARERLESVLENVLSAPVYIAVLVDSEARYADYVLFDGTLAAGSLMIAARTLGYGTGFFTTFFPEAEMKEFFSIPEQYRLICFTPVGIPSGWPEPPPKKKIEDIVIFESFQKSVFKEKKEK